MGADDKPTPTDVEIPDWTDGKVQTMIDDYERDCAAGMVPEYAKELKQKIQAEILAHQGNLITQLETIHADNGEEKETAILLDIWRKKMSTWQNIVNSLGENCMVTPTVTEPCTDFETPYNTHVDLCNQNMLPSTLADRFKATMQDCIDSSVEAAKSKEDAINTYKSMKGWESNAATKTAVEALQNELDTLEAEIADQKSRLAALPPSCFDEIDIILNFSGGTNDVDGDIPAAVDATLQRLANVLAPNPSLSVTILGHAQGGGGKQPLTYKRTVTKVKDEDNNVDIEYDISKEYNLTVGDVKKDPELYKKYKDAFPVDAEDDFVIHEKMLAIYIFIF